MELVYNIKDRPPFKQNIVFALQQIIAIMAATLLVPILVSAAGLYCDPAAALFGAGAGTVIYLLFTKFRSSVARLPSSARSARSRRKITATGDL